MESDIMKLLWFGAVFGAVIVAVRQLSYMWQDPRKETDAEKRRREKREKERGVQAQISRGAEPAGGEEEPPR
jgi:hypothetical protein